ATQKSYLLMVGSQKEGCPGLSAFGTRQTLFQEELNGLAVQLGKLLKFNRVDPPLASLDLRDVLLPHPEPFRSYLLAHAGRLPFLLDRGKELPVALGVSRRHARTI